jgi:hypothetical protein
MISKWMGVISLVLPIAAQTNDWRTVEQLKPGTPISIVEHGRQECELDSVTDSELICVMPMSRITRKLAYARSQIQEVRRETPDHNSMIVGAIAGGIAGGLLGYFATLNASDPETHGYSTYYAVPIGAFIGGIVGRHIHRHGAVLYRP